MSLRMLTVRARLMLVGLVSLVGLLTVAAIALYLGRSAEVTVQRLGADTQRLVSMQLVSSDLKEVRFRMAGVLLDQMPWQGTLNHLREVRQNLPKHWASAQQDMGEISADDRALLDAAQQGMPEVEAVLGRVTAAYEAKNTQALSGLLEDDWATVIKGFSKPLEALILATETAGRAAQAAQRDRTRVWTRIAAGVSVLSLLLVASVLVWVMRSIAHPLEELNLTLKAMESGDLTRSPVTQGHDELAALARTAVAMQASLRTLIADVRSGVDEVATASREIAQGNSDLSHRTEQQAGRLQQTASSMEHLQSTVRHNANNTEQADRLSRTVADVAHRGGDAVQRVVATMGDIEASSRTMGDIISVIESIAFQTNILALNAAVEAARAGEQGRGFAVVANEVRSLAHRSADAAKEIKQLIQSSNERVGQGALIVREAGDTMTEMAEQVRRMTSLLADISSATQQQNHGIAEVNTAIGQIDQATQQNAALVEQSAAAAESLREQAATLARATARFRVA